MSLEKPEIGEETCLIDPNGTLLYYRWSGVHWERTDKPNMEPALETQPKEPFRFPDEYIFLSRGVVIKTGSFSEHEARELVSLIRLCDGDVTAYVKLPD